MSAREEVRVLEGRQREALGRAVQRAAIAQRRLEAAHAEHEAAVGAFTDALALLTGEDPDALEYEPSTGTLYRVVPND